jgi:general secretion pathway protein C
MNSHHVWAPRLAAFGVAALLAASAMYWFLRWPAAADSGSRVAPVAAEEAAVPTDTKALAQLLGAGSSAAAGPVTSGGRFVLSGVVAGVAGHGAAVISIDGGPNKAYRVGSQVTEGLVLQSVVGRRAMLAPSVQAPATQTLELRAPETKAADATGPAAQPAQAAVAPQAAVAAHATVAPPLSVVPQALPRPSRRRSRAPADDGETQ